MRAEYDGTDLNAARRRFGNMLQIQEDVRRVWISAWSDHLARDVHFAWRGMLRDPLFSALAIATLALGIGGITAIFSAFDAVLIRALPYAEPDRLVMVWDDMSKSDITAKHNVTPAEWIAWRRLNTVFSDLATSEAIDAALSADGEPEELPVGKVTWTLWNVLGVRPMLGRVFTEEEDNNRARVVVISDGLWRRRFGASASVIGRKISLNDVSFEVIGVMPPRFFFIPTREIAMWIPASFPPGIRQNFTWHSSQVVARLKPGVTLAQARNSMSALSLQVTAKDFRGPHAVIINPLGRKSQARHKPL